MSNLRDKLMLLQSKDTKIVIGCLNDLKKLSGFSAKELKESGVYGLVFKLSQNRETAIKWPAQRNIRRWRPMMEAYERSELHDQSQKLKSESKKPESSSGSQCSLPVLGENHGNLSTSPRLPATSYRSCSGDSSLSDEPTTYHHGLEPERIRRPSKRDPLGLENSETETDHPAHFKPFKRDPLGLESGSDLDPVDGFRHPAGSGGSSGNSPRSTDPDRLDSKPNKRSLSHQLYGLENGAGFGEIYPQRFEEGGVPFMNGEAADDNSPEDPNLTIESVSVSPSVTCSDMVVQNSTLNRLQGFSVFKTEHEKCPQSTEHNIQMLLNSMQGFSLYYDGLVAHCMQHGTKEVPFDYAIRSYDFYRNASFKDLPNMPSCPSQNQTLDFFEHFRCANPRRNLMENTCSIQKFCHQYFNYRKYNPCSTWGKYNSRSRRLSASNVVAASSNQPSTLPAPIVEASSNQSSASSAPIVATSSNQSSTSFPPVVAAFSNQPSASYIERKGVQQTGAPMDQPEHINPDPARRASKTASSKSRFLSEPAVKASSSYTGFQGNQSANSNSTSSKIPKTTSTNVVNILKSVPAAEHSSHLSSGNKPITLFDSILHPNFKLVSPIPSPERTPSAPETTRQKPNHRPNVGSGSTLEPTKCNTLSCSPVVEETSLSVPPKHSSSETSPILDVTSFGASTGSPNLGKVPNTISNGPSTSRSALKEMSKERKPRQTKKPKKTKLWARCEKAYENLRKR